VGSPLTHASAQQDEGALEEVRLVPVHGRSRRRSLHRRRGDIVREGLPLHGQSLPPTGSQQLMAPAWSDAMAPRGTTHGRRPSKWASRSRDRQRSPAGRAKVVKIVGARGDVRIRHVERQGGRLRRSPGAGRGTGLGRPKLGPVRCTRARRQRWGNRWLGGRPPLERTDMCRAATIVCGWTGAGRDRPGPGRASPPQPRPKRPVDAAWTRARFGLLIMVMVAVPWPRPPAADRRARADGRSHGHPISPCRNRRLGRYDSDPPEAPRGVAQEMDKKSPCCPKIRCERRQTTPPEPIEVNNLGTCRVQWAIAG
jgi:hypothetical protein